MDSKEMLQWINSQRAREKRFRQLVLRARKLHKQSCEHQDELAIILRELAPIIGDARMPANGDAAPAATAPRKRAPVAVTDDDISQVARALRSLAEEDPQISFRARQLRNICVLGPKTIGAALGKLTERGVAEETRRGHWRLKLAPGAAMEEPA